MVPLDIEQLQKIHMIKKDLPTANGCAVFQHGVEWLGLVFERREKKSVSKYCWIDHGMATIVQGGANEFYKEGDQNAFR